MAAEAVAQEQHVDRIASLEAQLSELQTNALADAEARDALELRLASSNERLRQTIVNVRARMLTTCRLF